LPRRKRCTLLGEYVRAFRPRPIVRPACQVKVCVRGSRYPDQDGESVEDAKGGRLHGRFDEGDPLKVGPPSPLTGSGRDKL
jgi:hypothetical protein